MPPEGQFESDAVEVSWGRLRNEVMPRMSVDEPAWTEEPETAYRRGDPAEREILIQHLTDLGYLPEGASSVSDSTIRDAVLKWREENQSFTPSYLRFNTMSTCREFLASGEMQRLAAQVGLENELQVHRLPAPGERSLLARVVHFRMKVFNLGTGTLASGFTDELSDRLREVADQLKIKDQEGLSAELNLVQQLGDVTELTSSLMRRYGTWVFVFRHNPALLSNSVAMRMDTLEKPNKHFIQLHQPTRETYERLFISSGRHMRKIASKGARVRNLFGADGFRYYGAAKPLKWIRRAIETRMTAEEASEHFINRLGLGILQLRLWALGYYKGEVDGAWGPLSFAALQHFLADEKVEVKKLVRALAGGYIALNLRYLFKRILPKLEEPARAVAITDLNQLQEEVYARLEDSDGFDSVQQSYALMDRDEQLLMSNTTRRRRRYHGRRGIFAAIGRFFKRVSRSLRKAANAILKGIKSLVSSALHVFRHFAQNIRKGIRVIGLAVKRFNFWLLKKPFISGGEIEPHFALSRFDWDGDAFHYVQDGTSTQLISRHHRSIRRMNLAFAIVSRLAVKAINVMVLAVTYNWFRVAWTLVKLLTGGFWKELKVLIRRYRETFAVEQPVLVSA